MRLGWVRLPEQLPTERTVVIDGEMLFWVVTALTRAYRQFRDVTAITDSVSDGAREHEIQDKQHRCHGNEEKEAPHTRRSGNLERRVFSW